MWERTDFVGRLSAHVSLEGLRACKKMRSLVWGSYRVHIRGSIQEGPKQQAGGNKTRNPCDRSEEDPSRRKKTSEIATRRIKDPEPAEKRPSPFWGFWG